MANCGLPLTPTKVKLKVAEMTKEKIIPFKNGVFGHTWMIWIRNRHLEFTLRAPQGLVSEHRNPNIP